MSQEQNAYKVSWKGWLALTVLLISFSGIFTKADGPSGRLIFRCLPALSAK